MLYLVKGGGRGVGWGGGGGRGRFEKRSGSIKNCRRRSDYLTKCFDQWG